MVSAGNDKPSHSSQFDGSHTTGTSSHPDKYDSVLLRNPAGGGLSMVLRVARMVLEVFFSSSTMAAAVWSSKNT